MPPVSPYLLALGRGARAAIAGFLSLGVYALLRPVVRPAWRRFKRSVSADLRRPYVFPRAGGLARGRHLRRANPRPLRLLIHFAQYLA